MAPPEPQPEPRYVNCPCQHCSGNIEFDANQLEYGETRASCLVHTADWRRAYLCPHQPYPFCR